MIQLRAQNIYQDSKLSAPVVYLLNEFNWFMGRLGRESWKMHRTIDIGPDQGRKVHKESNVPKQKNS